MSASPSPSVTTTNTVYPTPVQELSIQYLSFKRTSKFVNVTLETIKTMPLKDVIGRVIQVYNENKKKKDDKSRDFEDRALKLANSMNYQTILYVQTQNSKSQLARELEEKGVRGLVPRQATDYLLFYYRDNPVREIMALSSGNAYQAIRACINYKFPLAIAKMLNPERILEITRRCLIGPDVKETILNPSGHEFTKSSSMYYLVESLRGEIEKTSSLMQLCILFPELKKSITADTAINIGTGLVRILRKMPLENYALILDLFSKAVRGQDTYTTSNRKEQLDHRFEFLFFLQPAPSAADGLDKALVDKVFEAYQNHELYSINLRHRFLDEFLFTSSSEIKIGNPKSHYSPLSNKVPTLEQVMVYLDDHDREALKSSESLFAVFNSGKLRYKKRDDNWEDGILIEFLEGEIRTAKGTYFKIRNMWYKLSADHHALLQEDFKAMLKKSLISPDVGLLQKPWLGNKKRGKITQSSVTEKFQNSKGIRAFMDDLKNTKVQYIDQNDDIKQKQLIGEILKNKTIAKHKKLIEEKILNQKKVPTQEELKKNFGDNSDEILAELKKKRSVLNDKQFVTNPFPYPLESKPAFKKIYIELVKFLNEQLNLSDDCEDEEAYNRSYLFDKENNGKPFGPDDGYLVFDQICPRGIEPCDVVKYTKDTVYLCHVKETLGQPTRDACSQALNAAKEFRSALSSHQAESYIEELWQEGSSSEQEGFRALVKQQLISLGKEKFLEIFYNRKLIFVYAFLDNENQSLYKESETPSRITPNAFKEIAELNSLKNQAQLMEDLKAKGYLDRFERLTGKFYETNHDKFEIEKFAKCKDQIYKCLCNFKSTSRSTLAKLELIRLASELQALGFEFKICPIKKGEDSSQSQKIQTSTSQNTQTQGFSELTIEEDEEDFSQDATQLASGNTSKNTQSTNRTTDPGHAKLVWDKVKGLVLPAPAPLKAAAANIITTPLPNLGNTCYMNAILQMIAHLPTFDHMLTQELQAKQGENQEKLSYRKAFQKHLCALVHQMRTREPKETIKKHLETFFELLHICGWQYDKGSQQDPQEFIGFLREQLGDAFERLHQIEVIKYKLTGSPDPQSKQNSTFVADLTVSIPYTTIGNRKIANTDNESLSSLIEKDSQPDLLLTSQGNGYNYNDHDKIDATKTPYLVEPAPATLFIHAKRFTSDGNIAFRIEGNIPFNSTIQLPFYNSQNMDAAPQKHKYELKVAICHSGGSSANSGHYISLVKENYKNPEWKEPKKVFMTYDDAKEPSYYTKDTTAELRIAEQGYYLAYVHVD